MSKKNLQKEDLSYIRQLIWKHDPALLSQIRETPLSELPPKTKDLIEGILADEICDSGIGPDGEINELGMKLEDLVQLVMDYE